MKTAIAIRHVLFEDLGAFTVPLAENGYTIDYLDIGLDQLTASLAYAPHLLIVLGGPVGVNDTEDYPFLLSELEILRARLQRRLPTLGICLGAQLMAVALGAAVQPGQCKEIGWSQLTLTAAGRASPLQHLADTEVLHWHGDVFALPEGARSLASTAVCPHQAFDLGPNILAFQCHPEADGQGHERWLIGHTVELRSQAVPIADLRRAAAKFGPAARVAGCRCLTQWLQGLNA